MNQPNPEASQPPESHGDSMTFDDKFEALRAGLEFEEPQELSEARRAVLEALTQHSQDSDLLQSVWRQYADICEPLTRQSDAIATSVHIHKALIYREAKIPDRYAQELAFAETYAYFSHTDDALAAIQAEITQLCANNPSLDEIIETVREEALYLE